MHKTRELQDLMDVFERTLKQSTRIMILGRFDREDRDTMWPRGFYYQDGNVNKAFLAFMGGYQYAKALARRDDLPLDG